MMIPAIIGAVIGIAVGAGGLFAYEKVRKANIGAKADKIITEAKKEASDILLKATEKTKEEERERRKRKQDQNTTKKNSMLQENLLRTILAGVAGPLTTFTLK